MVELTLSLSLCQNILFTEYHWIPSALFMLPADLHVENCSQKGSQRTVAETWYESGQSLQDYWEIIILGRSQGCQYISMTSPMAPAP